MALATSLGGRWRLRLLPSLALAASLIAAVPTAGAATAKPVAATITPPQTVSATPTARTPRIIGGTVVPDGGWPWIVSIRRSADDGLQCGGSVIASDLILTAAHCIYGFDRQLLPPGGLYVVAKQRQLQPITGEVRQVAKIVLHPAWENQTYGGDAALLFLKGNTSAPAIKMADLPFEASALNNGSIDWAAGWGSTAVWRRVGEQPPIVSRSTRTTSCRPS